MGTLLVCNEDPSSAIFHIEGYADPFVVHHVRASRSEGNISTYISDEDLNEGGHYINLHIPSTTTGNYPNTWSETGIRINPQLRLYCGEMAVDVYEYGSVNGYVRANMTGIFTPLDSSGVEYPFTGTFSALRKD